MSSVQPLLITLTCFCLFTIIVNLGTILRRWKKNWFDLWSDGRLIFYDDQQRRDMEDEIHMKVDCINIRDANACRGRNLVFMPFCSFSFISGVGYHLNLISSGSAFNSGLSMHHFDSLKVKKEDKCLDKQK